MNTTNSKSRKKTTVIGTTMPGTSLSSDSESRVVYNRSGIPARSGHSVDRAHRRVDQPGSYGLGLRVADNWHGWVDRKHGTGRELSSMEWVQRLQELHDENMARLLAATGDVNHCHVIDLKSLLEIATQLEKDIHTCSEELAAVPSPRSGQTAAERHLPTAVTDARRNREQDRAKAPVRSRLEGLKGDRAQALKLAAQLRSQLQEEFDLLLALEERHRAFAQRRLRTYTRRLSRGRDDYDNLRHDLNAPDWTNQPCPWIPASTANEATAAGGRSVARGTDLNGG